MEFDGAFIDRLRNRETEAFTILYGETEAMLYNYLLYRTGNNRTWAEEILSDIFCDAIDHAGSLTRGHNLKAWLLRIARSKIADFFRRLAREGKRKSGQPVEVIANGKGHGKDPEILLLEREDAAKVRTAFAGLSDLQRELLQKKYVDGMSMKELSAFYGKTERSIESMLYRTRNELKKLLERLERDRPYRPRGVT
ncbi:MAG: RNA polymerase sigma factor [Spirochaetales bacterium]|nr:RNA polymerase sigma factor [Spirochaetales bacterium]